MLNEGDIPVIDVSGEESGTRVDKLLATRVGVSRTRIRKAIDSGGVLVNENRISANYRVREGDRIEIAPIESDRPPAAVAEDIPINVVYEDDSFLIIDKSAGMVVHPAPGHYTGTLYNALLYHLKEDTEAGQPNPGLIHRLDKDTTGLLLVAKGDEAKDILSGMMKERQIKRCYRVIVWGHLKELEGKIESGIGRHPHDRKKMSTFSSKTRDAVTKYKILESYDVCDYLDVALLTGRTHQVRVHFSSIGHPVVGDETYGGGEGRETGFMGEGRKCARQILKLISRQALHAYSLKFDHPFTGEKMEFSSPVPEDMKQVLFFIKT